MMETCNATETLDKMEAAKIYSQRGESNINICACLGPRKGEPFCPCRMQNVVKVNGEYYEVRKISNHHQ